MKQRSFGIGATPGLPVHIGIDQSFSGFGLTVLSLDGTYRSTVTKFDGHGVDRLLSVQAFLKNVHSTCAGDQQRILGWAMEGYAYGSQMANMAGEMGATIKLILKQIDTAYPLIVPPTSLKKYATGRGNSTSKSQIMLAVYRKWGVELLDDNAADSFVLAKMSEGKPDLDYEREVLKSLEGYKHREVPEGYFDTAN